MSERKLLPSKFTPSGINEFYSCPKQWELHRKGIVGIPTNRDRADLGHCIHKSIREYFKVIGRKPTPEQIRKIFTTCFEQEWEKYSLGSLRKRALRICDNFIKFEIMRLQTWKTYLPTLVEEKRTNATYATRIDFYSEPERTLIDWKTGNKRDIDDNDTRQGKVMELVLKHHGYPVEKILFVALYPNRVFEVPQIGDGFVENERQKMQESISSNYFPKHERFCRWCDVVLECQFEDVCLWS